MKLSTVVSATVVTEDPEHVVKVAEAFSRVAAGLGVQGISVTVSIGVMEDDDDDDAS